MMDGGLNFKDTCHKCGYEKHGGSMRRYIHERNTKICDTCYDDNENKSEYVYANELKK